MQHDKSTEEGFTCSALLYRKACNLMEHAFRFSLTTYLGRNRINGNSISLQQ